MKLNYCLHMLGDLQIKDDMFMGSIINVTVAAGEYSPHKGDNKLARVTRRNSLSSCCSMQQWENYCFPFPCNNITY